VRIRENQRRSRNRKKELIDELQERVHQYERQGVAATLDMQRAARSVAEENRRLRSLLACHGVSQNEVESYLQSFNDGEASMNAAVASPHHQNEMVVNHSRVTLGAAQASNHARCVGQQNVNNSACIPPAEPRTKEVITTSSYSGSTAPLFINQTQQTTKPVSRPPEIHHDIRNGQAIDDMECPNTADCFCPPTTKPQTQPSNSSLEISCERAAAIITEMRGDVDMETIRASLGCAGRTECNVRNSTVLQILDEG
jgi:hypothetical protein